MARSVRIARIAGIDIRLDPTLLFVFALIVFSLGAGQFRAWHPDWGETLLWGTAVTAAVLFLASILLHELAHSLVATARGMQVRDITLFLFGGVSNLEREPPSPGTEFLMAVVGPLTSLALGVGFLAVGVLMAGTAPDDVEHMEQWTAGLSPVTTLVLWLGPVNLLLGIFNLVPGFPLDGGRLLRAALWGALGDLRRATRIAAAIGSGFGWLFVFTGVGMAFGLVVPFFGTGVGGLWLALIGWFLVQAARASAQQVEVHAALADVTVARVMTTDVATVPPDLTLDSLVDDYLARREQRAYPVVEGDRMLGLVCLEDVRRVPKADWPNRRASEVMTPRDRLVVTTPDTPAEDALRALAQRDVDQLPVLEDGRLRGLLRRRDVMRWLRFHSDLPVRE